MESLSNDDDDGYDGNDDAEDDAQTEMNFYYTFELRNCLDLFSAQAKYAMAAFNSKWKYEKLAVAVCVPQTMQNLVISRCCFAEDGKEMYKDL